MRYRHSILFFLLVSISNISAESSSMNWDTSDQWERIQPVLPTSETFYIPSAQPRLFTDVQSNEAFTGNHRDFGDFRKSEDSVGSFRKSEEAVGSFHGSEGSASDALGARYKRQHSALETQISSQESGFGASWNDPLATAESQASHGVGGMSVRSKRFNGATNNAEVADAVNNLQPLNSSDRDFQSSPDVPPSGGDASQSRTFLSSPGSDAAEKVDKADDPTAVLSGIYTECLLTLSFTCLQKKIIVLLEKLNKLQKFNLIGDYLTVVRNDKYATYRGANKPSREDFDAENNIIGRSNLGRPRSPLGAEESNDLKAMVDESIDNYFETHVIRLKVPAVFQQVANVTKSEDGEESTHIDFDLSDKFEGRRHHNKKKKDGHSKKMMAMMGMMLCYKLSMMGPMLMGLIGLKALKALILAVISLTISKMMLLKKLRWGNNGFGGGAVSNSYTAESGTSGTGWDRSLEAHNLAYNSYKPEDTTFDETLVPVVQHILSPLHAQINHQIMSQNL
ncbi:hypothetical protein M8J77_010535 [Diaphorina citri]|nr:hypothetical protein M8J77_010535 [Diaphorina citri]